MKARPGKAKPEPRAAPAPKRPPLTPGRKWLFRIVAMVLGPVVVFGAAELALRLGGYGYDTSYFKKLRMGGRDFYINNDDFSSRFFPPNVRRFPGAVRMAAQKPVGTYRIFIFGESAAMGDPEPAFGASRYLEALLGERFPTQQFEVVNVAFTAINSHVILPIARECARREGDLWMIYMGNNEMVGPFGAATVFGSQATPLWLVRVTLAMQQTRLGQLVEATVRRFSANPTTSSSWRGMGMFLQNQISPLDPRKERVYQNFAANLDDIVSAGANSGAAVILNTVAVNLTDCPPFASLANTNLPAVDRASWEKLFAVGVAAQERGDHEAAAPSFEAAAKLDPHKAELQYRWGQSLLALNNTEGAREHFGRACDDDALPFRATSRINEIIRQVGEEPGHGGFVLLDAAVLLATNSPTGISGEESFFEHVHFNFDGNYRLARLWAAQVEPFLPAATRGNAVAAWATQETCEGRLGLTDWNRRFVTQSVIRRVQEAPLNAQSNHARRLETLRAKEAELRGRLTPAAAANVRAHFQAALERAPEDYCLRENFADFLEAEGDLKEAIIQWQRVHELLPHDFLAEFQRGRLLSRSKQWAEAEPLLNRAVELRPTLTEGWYELGNLHAAAEKFELALADYNRATELRPHDPLLHCCAAKALVRLNRRPEGIERYREAIRLQPGYWEAHQELGNELAVAERTEEAKSEFEQVVRLKPDFALGHFNLGVILAKQGQLDAARIQFEETLRLQPDHPNARVYLDQLRTMKGRAP